MDLAHRVRHTWSRDLDQVIVLAAFTLPFFRQGGIREDRVSVVPNFVTDEGHVDAGGADGYLFVGRLTEDKGVRTLLEAWRQVPPGVTLTIAGTGPLEGEVADAAATVSNVRYVGRLDRAGVAGALAASRALIVPSHWYENCPLTVLEAFAAGRAVIASGHGGLAELVDDGVTGLHVAPADPVSLAAAIHTAEADPERLVAYGRAARARYDGRYSEARGYERLMAAYRRALARHEAHGRGSVSAS
jgi:glycosyltransferase involved in cell wall biosynthesis